MAIVEIREFTAEDAPELRTVFFSSVHENAASFYDQRQLEAWAPRAYDAAAWAARLAQNRPFVAVDGLRLVGYADLQSDGLIDHFYVRGGESGRGIGSLLMRKILATAAQAAMPRLSSNASLAAEAFFRSHGFEVVERRLVNQQGVIIPNARMEKKLIG